MNQETPQFFTTEPTEIKGTIPAAQVQYWFVALDTQDPMPEHFRLARLALEKEDAGQTNQAVDALARALLLTLPIAGNKLGLFPADAILLPTFVGDVLWLDERAAQYLETEFLALDAASEIRNSSKTRREEFLACQGAKETTNHPDPLWRLWVDDALVEQKLPTLRFAILLTRVLWRSRVSQWLERLDRYQAPTMTKAMFELATFVFHTTQKAIVEEEFKWLLQNKETGRTVAHVDKEDLAAMARRPFAPVVDRDVATQLSASRSLAGQRLLRFLVGKGFQQKLLQPQYDYRTVRVKGGLSGLASLLGMEKGKASEKLGMALDALHTTQVALPHGGHDSVLMWSLYPEAPGRGALLKIIMGDPLLPGYVFALPDRTDRERQARRLIPFPELLPKMVGSPNLHAAQAVLQMLIIEQLSDRAEEFLSQGCIEINDANWKELCDRAEVPSRLVPELKEAWAKGDGDKTPAFLLQPSTDRFCLSPAYEKERRVIEETAEMTQKSRERGKARVRARRGLFKKKK